jgi:hypothetical protein
MKKIQLLAVFGVVLAVADVTRAESNVRPASITVVGVQGEARYSIDGKAWHPMVIGKILHAGAVLETASGSSCDLVLSGTPLPIPENSSAPFSDAMLSIAPDPNIRGYVSYRPMTEQNVVRMSQNTMLAVDTLTEINTGADTVGNTELDLRAGKIFTSVKKLSASSQYIIKLPNGVAGIRGMYGTFSPDDIDVGGGTVVASMTGADGLPHVVVIHGGEGYNTQNNQVFTLPPNILAYLSYLSNQLQTIYLQILALERDLTCTFISNTEGHQPFPPPGGNGNNNNNNNDGGGVSVLSGQTH